MALTDSQDPEVLKHYEGLIFKTAALTAPLVEDDFEDVQQVLRIKTWRALIAYDPKRSRMSRDRYVFMVLRNQTKDLLKRKRRSELSIDQMTDPTMGDLRNDAFDEQYLSSTADEVYGHVEEGLPLIPSTLTAIELRVVCLLYRDFKQSEVARELGVEKREIERHVRQIRSKMADWRPSTSEIPVSKPETAAAA